MKKVRHVKKDVVCPPPRTTADERGTMFVYLIRSERFPERKYIGLTEDFKHRLEQHNKGDSPSTYKYRPWRCEVLVWFDDPNKAKEFEAYLKSGSGWTFSKRHFW